MAFQPPPETPQVTPSQRTFPGLQKEEDTSPPTARAYGHAGVPAGEGRAGRRRPLVRCQDLDAHLLTDGHDRPKVIPSDDVRGAPAHRRRNRPDRARHPQPRWDAK
eukprot:3771844-Prymnesium_polylepis.1